MDASEMDELPSDEDDHFVCSITRIITRIIIITTSSRQRFAPAPTC
jgi:hypothetical protein